MCKMFPPVQNSAKIIKIDHSRYSRVMIEMYCHIFMVHSVLCMYSYTKCEAYNEKIVLLIYLFAQ